MEQKGRVVKVLPVETIKTKSGDKQKQAIVIEWYEQGQNGEQYSKKLMLDSMRKAESLGKLAVGIEINAKCNVTSREYNGRWFTQAEIFGWEILSQAPKATPPTKDEAF